MASLVEHPGHFALAIVGGGIAGLVAACDSARAGRSTIMFDAAPTLGGRAHTHLHAGFSFNQGPHALYAGGVFAATLAAFGITYTAHAPVLDGAVTLWNGRKYPLPMGLGTIARLTALGVIDRLQLGQVMKRVADGDYDCPGQPLRAYTASLRPKVAQVIEAFARLATYANAPERIDGQAALDQIRLSFGGVVYVDGGWQILIAGLERVARAAGVQIEAPARITAVVRDGTGWRLTAADGHSVTADAVILALPPGDCARLAPMSPALATAAATARPVKAVCLDLALANVPVPSGGFALGIDEPLYFSLHSKVAALAPPGGGLLHAALYLPDGVAATRLDITRLEALVDMIQPGWREVEVHRQRLVGITVVHDIPQCDRPKRRTPVIVDDCPGLFVAGDWVGDTAMLSDASAASARVAAQAALAYVNRTANAA